MLRDEWGFDGIVVSDYAGIDELVESHAIVGDLAAAAVLALEAGVDVELPSTVAFGAPLAAALADGRVDPALVDRAVARVLAVKFELGLFEAPYVDVEAAHPPLEADRALAREAARASIVLLSNDGILPLRDDLRDDRGHRAQRRQRAQPAGRLRPHRAHRDAARDARQPDRLSGPRRPQPVRRARGRSTILDAIRERCAGSAEVRFAPGGGVLDAATPSSRRPSPPPAARTSRSSSWASAPG